MTEEEYKLYNYVSFVYNACFVLAKQNKIHEADNEYVNCSQVKRLVTNNIYPWVTLFCDPYLSYYYYKIGSYKQAISNTLNSIKIARKLQKQGYQYLFLVEVQQFHNLSRVYLKEGEFKKAIYLYIKCFEKIIRQNETFTTTKCTNSLFEIELIKKTEYEKMLQIFTETYDVIIKKFDNDILLIKKWLSIFFSSIVVLDFKYRYINFYMFIKIMNELSKEFINNKGNLTADISKFLRSSHSNKKLLTILFNYMTILNRQNMLLIHSN